MKKKTSELTARKLKIILSVTMLLLLILATGSFVLVANQLHVFANDVTELDAKAVSSNSDLIKLQNLEKVLAQNADSISKTHKIVAESKSYQYQDEIIDDITQNANDSNIDITGFSFASSATPKPGAATTPGAAPTASVLPGGIKTASVTVSIKQRTNYNNFMKFIQLIETNATKMQIKSVTASRSSDDPKSIDPQDLQIEVYIR